MGKRSDAKRIRWELRLLYILSIVLLFTWLGRAPLANWAGRLLVRDSDLRKGDVLFVMGGEPELLVPFAVDLWSSGYAMEIWCATTAVSNRQKAFFAQYGVRRDEQHAAEEALGNSPVPRSRWRVLPGSISTYTDIALLHSELARHPKRSVIIVSMPYHTLRIGFVLRKMFQRDEGLVDFSYAYPSIQDFRDAKESQDKVTEAIYNEVAKNIVYRLRYGF